MKKNTLLSAALTALKQRGILYTALCVVLASVSCTLILPVKFSPFEEVSIASCEDVVDGSPWSITDVFGEGDQRVCVYVEAKFEKGAIAPPIPTDAQIDFTFAWYYGRELIAENYVFIPFPSDTAVTVSDCLVAEGGSFTKGQYMVVIYHGDIRVGEIEFQVE
jgi:hypothetical protein